MRKSAYFNNRRHATTYSDRLDTLQKGLNNFRKAYPPKVTFHPVPYKPLQLMCLCQRVTFFKNRASHKVEMTALI